MTKHTLLATRLHRPLLPAQWVRRPQLCERLNAGLALQRQIILVSAPAGFGKTTCINEWLHTLEGWPVSWLTLDRADDDPRRFLAYFIAALQKIAAGLGQDIEQILDSGQLPPAEVITATLINDMSELEHPFLLVLDDFHVIQDSFTLQILESLVVHLPPQLILVLITREDPSLPLARFRANNQLTEIRAHDLRLSRDDTTQFLNTIMGLSLAEADVAVLENRTEGWIAGLQLAGLSVQNQADPSRYIASLDGSHRFIMSYLTEQVLSQQPEAIRQFLLQTAILDELNGDLCNAVTGRTDSSMLLERLFSANLFVNPLDDARQWYRYHHLFADLLRDLQNAAPKAETAELHRRASHWYRQAGRINEAVHHALAAEDYPMAVDLLESHALDMIMQGYARTVNNWVQAMPPTWVSQSPRTNLAFAWMHSLGGEVTEVAAYLERLRESLIDTPHDQPFGAETPSLRAEWLAIQSLLRYGQGQPQEGADVAERALEIAPEQDSRVRSFAWYALASNLQLMGDQSQAIEAYQKAIQYGRAAGNHVAEMLSVVCLAMIFVEQGQLHLAFEVIAPVADRQERAGSLTPMRAVLYGVFAEIYYQWLQIDRARQYALQALRLCTLGGYNSGIILCRVQLSRLALLAGDLDIAAQTIQEAADWMQRDAPSHVRQEVIAQQVNVYLARNRPDAARMVIQTQGFAFQETFTFPNLPADQRITYSAVVLYNSSLRLLLHLARSRRDPSLLRPGLALANHLMTHALEGQHVLLTLETRLLRARIHALLGDNPSSQADVVQALELSEPEGILAVFVEQGLPLAETLLTMREHNQLGMVQPDYVDRILDAFSSLPVAPVAAMDSLTDRELEVLRWMAAGLKYKEIADRLFISLNTVRYHAKSIYGKLQVNTRAQAIEAARQRHLL